MKILALAFVGLAQASDAPWHNCTKCTWSPEQITDPMRCIAATGACSAYACSEETLPDGNVSGEHANIHSDLAARPRMLSHSSTHPPPPPPSHAPRPSFLPPALARGTLPPPCLSLPVFKCPAGKLTNVCSCKTSYCDGSVDDGSAACCGMGCPELRPNATVVAAPTPAPTLQCTTTSPVRHIRAPDRPIPHPPFIIFRSAYPCCTPLAPRPWRSTVPSAFAWTS